MEHWLRYRLGLHRDLHHKQYNSYNVLGVALGVAARGKSHLLTLQANQHWVSSTALATKSLDIKYTNVLERRLALIVRVISFRRLATFSRLESEGRVTTAAKPFPIFLLASFTAMTFMDY